MNKKEGTRVGANNYYSSSRRLNRKGGTISNTSAFARHVSMMLSKVLCDLRGQEILYNDPSSGSNGTPK